jgi:hypothetical protein
MESRYINMTDTVGKVLDSIACEQYAVGKLLCAEYKKLCFITSRIKQDPTNDNLQLLITANQSAEALLARIESIETILKSKTRIIFCPHVCHKRCRCRKCN